MIHAKRMCKRYITTFEASIVDRLHFGKHLPHIGTENPFEELPVGTKVKRIAKKVGEWMVWGQAVSLSSSANFAEDDDGVSWSARCSPESFSFAHASRS